MIQPELEKEVISNSPEHAKETGRHSTTAVRHRALLRSKLDNKSPLQCPLCHVTFSQWPSMEHHLYAAHSTGLPPVCWRCQGVFNNHAVLLAHECFDWGRLRLPCSSTLKRSGNAAARRHRLATSEDLGYPSKGVFLRRRCGLCFNSEKEYDSFDEFEKYAFLQCTNGWSIEINK